MSPAAPVTDSSAADVLREQTDAPREAVRENLCYKPRRRRADSRFCASERLINAVGFMFN